MRRAARPLLYAGVLAVVFGLAQIHATQIGHYSFAGTFRFGWTMAYAAIVCVCAYGFGLPEVPRTKRAVLTSAVGASFAGAAVISVIQLFVGDALLPRFVVFGSALLLPDWFRICTRLASGGRLRAEGRDRLVLVAGAEDAAALALELTQNPEKPAAVATHLTVMRAQASAERRPLLEAAAHATVVVLDRDAQEDESIVAQAAELHERGLRVRTLTAFYEEWLGKLPITELERASMLFDIGEVHRPTYSRMKRVMDVGLGVVGLVPLIILVPVAWLANLVWNRGPLFYRQERVGKGGSTLAILKLRTMRPSLDSASSEWTSEEDPRVTSVGRILRATHLDELPQVVNILRGDLSVVGPRPEQPRYVDELTQKLRFYNLRHSVRPGLTGWAQVKYGYAGDETDALEKLQYEFWYLRHQSLSTDVKIIGRTIRAVLGSEGGGR